MITCMLYFMHMFIDQNISQKFRPQLSRGHFVIYMALDARSFIKSENLAIEDWTRDCEWAKYTLIYMPCHSWNSNCASHPSDACAIFN